MPEISPSTVRSSRSRSCERRPGVHQTTHLRSYPDAAGDESYPPAHYVPCHRQASSLEDAVDLQTAPDDGETVVWGHLGKTAQQTDLVSGPCPAAGECDRDRSSGRLLSQRPGVFSLFAIISSLRSSGHPGQPTSTELRANDLIIAGNETPQEQTHRPESPRPGPRRRRTRPGAPLW